MSKIQDVHNVTYGPQIISNDLVLSAAGGMADRCEELSDPQIISDDLVPSAAGGMADRCEHLSQGLRCDQEAYAVCDFCQVVLCHIHFNQSRCHEHNALALCPCIECMLSTL